MADRNSEAICPCAAEFHRLRLSDRQPPLNAILFTSHSLLGASRQRYESNSGASIVTGHGTLGLRPLAQTRVKGNNSRNFRHRSDLWIVSAPGARDRWSSEDQRRKRPFESRLGAAASPPNTTGSGHYGCSAGYSGRNAGTAEIHPFSLSGHPRNTNGMWSLRVMRPTKGDGPRARRNWGYVE
jgi:hypothetical protein